MSKAIELNPKNVNAWACRAEAKLKLEDYQGAIDDFTKAIELDTKNAIAWVNRGLAKANLEDYQSAIDDYSKALKLNPYDQFKKYIYQCRSEAYKKLSELDLENS